MKKRLLALAAAMVMTVAMSITVCAAPSVSAPGVSNPSVSTPAVSQTTTQTPYVVPSAQLATGSQQFRNETMEEFATTTTVTSTVNATISAVSTETAAAAIAEARAVVGDNAFIASIVDLNVPAGTGTATFTLGCPNVWAGQSVIILHQKADGTWERITPSNVANNAVTFTLTSYSPVAIVIDTTAPKTGDVVTGVAVMALISLAGTAVFGRKKTTN